MDDQVKAYFRPAYVICVAILAISVAGMSYAIHQFGIALQKTPLPLKKSFDEMTREGLGVYTFVKSETIEPEIEESLGTKDYVKWILEDTSVPDESPVKNCFLFITYYGQVEQQVPHVPEECYLGGGYQKLTSESLPCMLQWGDRELELSVRRLTFVSQRSTMWGESPKFGICYFFKVNGVYGDSRDDARAVLAKNVFGEHSYFSKVEWFYYNQKGQRTNPDKETMMKANARLMQVFLPILERDHWPVWEE